LLFLFIGIAFSLKAVIPSLTFPFGGISPTLQKYRQPLDEYYAIVKNLDSSYYWGESVEIQVGEQNITVNKIVLLISSILDDLPDYSFDSIISNTKSGKYDAIISLSPIPIAEVGYLSQICTLVTFKPENILDIPVYTMHFVDGSVLYNATYNESSHVIVKISPFDVNPWEAAFDTPAFGFWRLILFPIALFNLITACVKEFYFIKRKSFNFNVAQCTLMVHILSNGIRTVILFIDPIFSQGVLPFEYGTFLNTITFPMEVITLLLITFYWFTLIDNSKKVDIFLGNFNIPFIIIGLIILLQEIVGGIFRINSLSIYVSVTIIINAILYLVIYIPSIIFFYVIGFMVLRVTRTLPDSLSKKIRKLTIRILISGIFQLLWLVPIVLTITDYLFLTPESYITIWFLLIFLLLISSAIQLSALDIPPKITTDIKNDNNMISEDITSVEDSID